MPRLAAGTLDRLAPPVFHLGGWLPERSLGRLGRGLARTCLPVRRERVERHVAAVLGEPLPAGFWEAHLGHLGATPLECFKLYAGGFEGLTGRLEVSGLEHLQAVRAQGRGAVLFLNHLGNPAGIVAALGQAGVPLTIAGNRIDITLGGRNLPLVRVERLVQRMCERAGVGRALLGERLPARLAETLAANGVFGMFIDFPVGRKRLVAVPFGKARIELSPGPAVLALRQGAPVLTASCRRVGANRHRVRIDPPLEPPEGAAEGRARELLARAIGRLAVDLASAPEQWWPWDFAPLHPQREGS